MTAYFSLPEGYDDDHTDALRTASNVIKAIQAFIGGSRNPFEGFDTSDYSALCGLNAIFQCVTHAIDTVHDEIGKKACAERTSRRVADDVKVDVDRDEAFAARVAAMLVASGSGGDSAGVGEPAALTARDAAILETYRRGYELEAIAQAVNLKKASVQQIIERLRATGDIPQERGEEDQAASA